jgi:S1-C subfamily serine protease
MKVLGQAPSCDRSIEGSGFVFAPEHVLTNAHVVAGTSHVQVQQPGVGTRAATVVLYDPERDIAVLDVPGLTAPVMRLAATPANRGDPATVLGYPEDGPFTVAPARVSARETVSGSDIYGNGSVDRDVYVLRAVVRSGNSGGPLLADDGSVLGVVFATARNSSDTGYALTASEIGSDAAVGSSATKAVATSVCTAD